jgi:hypothetical protein
LQFSLPEENKREITGDNDLGQYGRIGSSLQKDGHQIIFSIIACPIKRSPSILINKINKINKEY